MLYGKVGFLSDLDVSWNFFIGQIGGAKVKHVSVKLNLLLFSLQKKREALEEIRQCTMQEGNEAASQKMAELFARKQERIREMERLDQGFDRIIKEVLPILKGHPEVYKEEIRQM